jgi:nicotianamine synthase
VLIAALGRSPDSVAILGSGALPETGIWIVDWARANGKRIQVHNVDIVQDRLDLSRQVYDVLELDESNKSDVSFEVGDARDAPADLSGFDAVYFNATVGSTVLEKESILLDVVGRMRKGAYMLTRSTHSLKTMAYPVSAGLRVLTCDVESAIADMDHPRLSSRPLSRHHAFWPSSNRL